MISIKNASKNVQLKFKCEAPGDELDDSHMAKVIYWAVQSFKKDYPLLFERPESVRGPKFKYELDELLAFDCYSVYHGKRTYRQREEWLTNDDESCNFILNNKSPSKSTMNSFKLDYGILFVEFFYYTVELGLRYDRVSGEVVTLDSTKIKAYANKYRTVKLESLIYLLDLIYDLSFDNSKNSKWYKLRKFFFKDKLPKDMVDLVEEIDKNLNHHCINLLKTALISQKKRDWVIGVIDSLMEQYDGKNPINLTDPESRKMRMKDDTTAYGYTVQTVRDVYTGYTIVQKVTQEKNDKNGFMNVVDDVNMSLGYKPRYMLMDNGYRTKKMLELALQHGIIPICPDVKDSMRRNGTRRDAMFDSSNMKFNPVSESFKCAFSQDLKIIGIREINEADNIVFRTDYCPNCPFQEDCTNNDYREVVMSAHPLFLESKKDFWVAEQMGLYKYRGIISEGGFGNLFQNRQYPDLRRKGIKKAHFVI